MCKCLDCMKTVHIAMAASQQLFSTPLPQAMSIFRGGGSGGGDVCCRRLVPTSNDLFQNVVRFRKAILVRQKQTIIERQQFVIVPRIATGPLELSHELDSPSVGLFPSWLRLDVRNW